MSDENDKGKKQKTDGIFDIFILNSTYPEAEAIFTSRPKSLDELKSECLIVLDTNALLVPYNIGKESLEQIQKTYKALVISGRLVIPGQVSREFAKNRAGKLGELYQQFNRKANIPKLQKGTYPLLESLEEYQETLHLEEQIDQLLRKYKDATQKVLSHIRSWTWNDPVSLLYAGLFEKAIFDLQIDKGKVAAELTRRQEHSIPPGYKDAGKEDNGIGDLLIWLTILEIGKNHKKSVFFVSGDEKADWWHRSEGQALYPRYELVDEFRRYSEGQSFHIIPFSQFLELYGASESIVEEVRREEVKLSLELGVIGEFIRKWKEFEQALYAKGQSVNPDIEIMGIRGSVFRMLEMLLKYQAISDDFFHRARETSKFRNQLIHEGAEPAQNRIREEIARLDELLSELK
jgi:rRNA-processing protein FCF1